jgi:hypothetical protein
MALLAWPVVLLLGLAIFFSYGSVLARQLTVTWDYDYSRQPACTQNRSNDCIQGFEILDYTNPDQPKLLRSVANPNNSAGRASRISDEFSYGPPFGLRTIVVVAVARDNNGLKVISNPYAARRDVEILPKILGHAKRSR